MGKPAERAQQEACTSADRSVSLSAEAQKGLQVQVKPMLAISTPSPRTGGAPVCLLCSLRHLQTMVLGPDPLVHHG